MHNDTLKLSNGSRIGVIGGGPSGSFFTRFLLDFSKRLGLALSIDVYDPKDFSRFGPKGCNNCGGIVSESLVQFMASEGIVIPNNVLQRGIEAYVLHTDEGSVRIDTPLFEKRIAAIYRGGGPLGAKETGWESFDGFLQKMCSDEQVNFIHESVQALEFDAEAYPIITTKKGQQSRYDLIVGAPGSSPHFLKAFEDMGFGYKMPSFTKTSISEVYLGHELLQRHFGNAMHVFLLDIPRLKFAAIIPKGDYVTIALLGEELDNELLKAFLDSEQVKACFPEGMPLYDNRACKCFPQMYTKSAEKPYGNRVVMIGDAASSKLYKNGIGAAYASAKAAAAAAIFNGIGENDFKEHYWPQCEKINRDNFLGAIVFMITGLIQKLSVLKYGILKLVAKEQRKAPQKRYMSAVLWDTFTGSSSYTDIFVRALKPPFLYHLVVSVLAGIFSSKTYHDETQSGQEELANLGKTYENSEVVITQGESGDCMYVIQSGQVEVFHESENRCTLLAVLGEGEFFGEMALFEREVRSATIRAKGRAHILTVDKKTLLMRFKEDPSMAFRILEKLSFRLQQLNVKFFNENSLEEQAKAYYEHTGDVSKKTENRSENTHTYKNGEIIVKAGEIGETTYLIKAGVVRVTQMEGGKEVQTAEYGKGEFLCGAALFEKMPCAVSAYSKGETVLQVVDKAQFLQMVRSDPKIAHRMVQRMSAKIKALNSKFHRHTMDKASVLRDATDLKMENDSF